MRNSLIIAVSCAAIVMAVDPTSQPVLMEAAAVANCFPTATACPDSPFRQNSTINFPKLPSPTSLVPYAPGPMPDHKEEDDDSDDSDDDDDDDDDEISDKPGMPEKMPHMPNRIPDQHIMPNDHYLETITMTTTVCIPTIITSVITHQKSGPTPRPIQTPKPDRIYMPRPTASAYKPDKFTPRFTGAASVTKRSGVLVLVVGVAVLVSLA